MMDSTLSVQVELHAQSVAVAYGRELINCQGRQSHIA